MKVLWFMCVCVYVCMFDGGGLRIGRTGGRKKAAFYLPVVPHYIGGGGAIYVTGWARRASTLVWHLTFCWKFPISPGCARGENAVIIVRLPFPRRDILSFAFSQYSSHALCYRAGEKCIEHCIFKYPREPWMATTHIPFHCWNKIPPLYDT